MMSPISNYAEFEQWLLTLAPPTCKTEGQEYQWPLDNMYRIDAYMGFPSKQLHVIHIAGTNGKGSTVSYLAALMMKAGYTVGYYRSPQMFDIRERVYVNNQMINKTDVLEYVAKISSYLESNGKSLYAPEGFLISYSEFIVSLAFWYFAQKQVDIAIIETGIGGLNDPTNIIEKPELSIITSIGYDHVRLLGDTLKEIAIQKAGIIKAHVPVIVGHVEDDEVRETISEIASGKQSEVFFADDAYPFLPTEDKLLLEESSDMTGQYQEYNLQTVSSALHEIRKHRKIPLSLQEQQDAVRQTAQLTGLYGRWQVICKNPTIIADAASNIMGMALNFKQLSALMASKRFGRLVMIFGITSKDYADIKQYLPQNAFYIITESHCFLTPREIAEILSVQGYVSTDVRDAIRYYKSISLQDDLVYIGGSTLIVRDALSILSCP